MEYMFNIHDALTEGKIHTNFTLSCRPEKFTHILLRYYFLMST